MSEPSLRVENLTKNFLVGPACDDSGVPSEQEQAA